MVNRARLDDGEAREQQQAHDFTCQERSVSRSQICQWVARATHSHDTTAIVWTSHSKNSLTTHRRSM